MSAVHLSVFRFLAPLLPVFPNNPSFHMRFVDYFAIVGLNNEAKPVDLGKGIWWILAERF